LENPAASAWAVTRFFWRQRVLHENYDIFVILANSSLAPSNQMAAAKTNNLSRGDSELEQTFERMRLNCELALEIIRRLDLNRLNPASRERLYSQIHTLREIVRILSPEFEKKLIVATAVSSRDLSQEEVLSLLYGLDEL
jgi:hypothetical protein